MTDTASTHVHTHTNTPNGRQTFIDMANEFGVSLDRVQASPEQDGYCISGSISGTPESLERFMAALHNEGFEMMPILRIALIPLSLLFGDDGSDFRLPEDEAPLA